MLPGFGAQDENLDVGVNILFDTARQQPFRPPQWAQPQAHDAPLVREPCGTLSNVGRVVETFPDGREVARVCNCVEKASDRGGARRAGGGGGGGGAAVRRGRPRRRRQADAVADGVLGVLPREQGAPGAAAPLLGLRSEHQEQGGLFRRDRAADRDQAVQRVQPAGEARRQARVPRRARALRPEVCEEAVAAEGGGRRRRLRPVRGRLRPVVPLPVLRLSGARAARRGLGG